MTYPHTDEDKPVVVSRAVFRYRHANQPGGWAIFLADPGTTLEEATMALQTRHGEGAVLEVRNWMEGE